MLVSIAAVLLGIKKMLKLQPVAICEAWQHHQRLASAIHSTERLLWTRPTRLSTTLS